MYAYKSTLDKDERTAVTIRFCTYWTVSTYKLDFVNATPYQVNMLMGGYDNEAGPVLYFVDYLAALVKIPYYAYGYGGYVSLSVIDRYYGKGDMTPEEGYELLKKCVVEIQKRLVINLPNFQVQMISKDGIVELPNITAKTLAVEETKAG
ncbi:Proteasome subunit beta type-2 [Homalodisca vitripennis]|nr:Proteasome subunit beta type-2 [Homalodisca vitripennis]